MLDWVLWVLIGMFIVDRTVKRKHKGYQKYFEKVKGDAEFRRTSDSAIIVLISVSMTVTVVIWPLLIIRNLFKIKN